MFEKFHLILTIGLLSSSLSFGQIPEGNITHFNQPSSESTAKPAAKAPVDNANKPESKKDSSSEPPSLPDVNFDTPQGDGKTKFDAGRAAKPKVSEVIVTRKLKFKKRIKDIYANMLIEYTLRRVKRTGKIRIKFYPLRAPKTVNNFVNLAEGNPDQQNKPFYNGLKFHRIIKNFVAQAGDPTGKGKGGGPGYKLPLEFSSILVHDRMGVVSMVRSGNKSHGSQFFITLGPSPSLDRKNTVFGQVIEGAQVLKDLQNVRTNKQDVPKKDVIIKSITIDRTYM